MTERELDRICQSSPDCGCNCYRCEAMARYQMSQLGIDELNEEED